jgi:hypothetical protein
VVTDVDDGRLNRAKQRQMISPELAKQNGVELHYVNPRSQGDQYE